MLKSYIAFDVETTGLNPARDEVIEIGALKVRDGRVADRFMEFIRPSAPISPFVTKLTGITDEMVGNARSRKDVIRDFLAFCEDDVLIGHNISFDYSFIKTGAAADGMSFEKNGIDTLRIARRTLPDLESRSLESLCGYYGILNKAAHRAYHDALATAKLYQTLAHYFESSSPKLFIPFRLCYKVKTPQPATPKQIAFLSGLIRKKRAAVSWDPDTISRSDASKLIDMLLKQ